MCSPSPVLGVAKAKVDEIFARHKPRYIDEEVDAAIRSKYPIKLD